MCEQISVGQRLQIDDFKATVLYVGPVEGQKGDWAGLEWDDHTRGKHDGSHGGKRYFKHYKNMVQLPSTCFFRALEIPKSLEKLYLTTATIKAILQVFCHAEEQQVRVFCEIGKAERQCKEAIYSTASPAR